MTDYRDLRFNETCWKATHNSYAKPVDLATQLAHDPAHPHQYGARGLELDLYHDKLMLEFWVCHWPPGMEKDERPLSHWLGQLLAWSGAGNHDPVTVTLDIKKMRGGSDGWAGVLDRYLLRHFDGDRIFQPSAFAGAGHTSLVKAVHEQGWPTIGEMRGKFLFVLSGADTRKQQYVRQPFGRVCFADRSLNLALKNPSTTSGNRIFLNCNLAELSQFDEESDELGWDLGILDRRFDNIVNNTAYVTRGYGLNNSRSWTRAGKLGVNARATDELTDKEWSTVGAAPYAERKFTGTRRRARSGTG